MYMSNMHIHCFDLLGSHQCSVPLQKKLGKTEFQAFEICVQLCMQWYTHTHMHKHMKNTNTQTNTMTQKQAHVHVYKHTNEQTQ